MAATGSCLAVMEERNAVDIVADADADAAVECEGSSVAVDAVDADVTVVETKLDAVQPAETGSAWRGE